MDISANDLANNDVVNNDVDAPDDTVVTLAHWAVNEKRFGAYFSPVTEEEVVDFAEYINLDERGRKGKTAVVSVISGEEEKRLMVDDKLVRAAENANDTWQVLQELAGTVTPFTSDVEERVRLEVQSEHDAEIAAVREEYEKQLREQGDSVRSDIAGNIRSQLVRLVNSAPSQTE